MSRVTVRLWIGLFLVSLLQVYVQTQDCVGFKPGETVVMSCGVELTGGVTITIATWKKVGPPDVNVAQYQSGNSNAGPDYTGRASINSAGFLQLEQVTPGDEGMYKCEPILSQGNSPIVQVYAKHEVPPDTSMLSVTAKSDTDTSALVEWKELPVNGTCDGRVTYHIDYKLNTSSTWQEGVGIVQGTANGTKIMNFNVTGLNERGNYTFGVRANNSMGFSDRVVSDDLLFIIGRVLTELLEYFISLPLVIAFGCLALFAAIIMIVILVADNSHCGTCCTVKCLAWAGPVFEALVAVIVLIMAAAPYKEDQGFITIVVLSAVALGISITAAIAGCLFQKCCNKVNFPVVTMALLFCLGLMVAIAGIVISVVREKKQETKVAGIVLGAISIALLVAAIIWFMVRVICGKKQCSQDLPGPEVRQEDNEDL